MSSEKPTISVVINNYNYADFVATAIKSAISQTYENVECVVVDDGSTDGSAAAIERFEGIKKFFKANGGQTSAVRLGVNNCVGDVVILLDSDDYLYPDACATIAENWKAGTTLLQYKLDKIDIAGTKLGEYPERPFLTSNYKQYAVKWGELPSSPTSGNAFSRDHLLSSLALIADDDVLFADGFFVTGAPLFGDVQIVQRALGAYLVHGKNVSTSSSHSLSRIIAQMRVHISQRSAFLRQLRHLRIPCGNTKSLLGPYHWRTIAFILRAYPEVNDFKDYSISEACLRGTYQYARFPSIPLWNRIKGIAALCFLPFVPRAVIRAKIPLDPESSSLGSRNGRAPALQSAPIRGTFGAGRSSPGRRERMKANLSTFDVFDTAVTRTVFHPDHLHWLVGAYLGELKYFDGDADAWREVRIEAERTSRLKSSLEEVTLEEIYRQISVRLGWGHDETVRAMNIELSIELALSRSVHSVLEDHRRASKQSIGAAFISDTYFDKSFVVKILSRSGYVPSTQHVFVSSEFGKTKHSGNLYREVIAATATRPGAISHTGDNFYSDITVARRLRVRAKHFEESRQNGYERAGFDAAGADCIASVIAGSARAARLAAPALEPCAKAVARVGANVAGPLITGFVLHALMEGQRQSVDQVHFLARDGQVMKRIADQLCAMFGCTIETHYTLVSRKALLLPSLLGRSDRLSLLAANSAGTTVGRLLRQLEISSDIAERLVIGSGLDCDTRIGGDEYGQQKLTELLGSIEADIDCAIEEESNAFRIYLEKIQVLAAKRILVVDVGWKGNLQLRMQRALGAMSVDEQPKIYGVYFGLTQVPEEIASRVNVFFERPPSGELIETFCAADHVSLSSYQDLTNSGEVERTMAPDERAVAWGVKLQQDSMVSFASNLAASFRYAKPEPITLVKSLKAAGLAAMNEFVQRPEPDDAETYGGMLHAPDADHIDFRQLAPKLSSVELAELFLPRRWRSRAEGCNWIEGSLTRSVPNAAARRAILNAWKIRSGKSRPR